jgi:hypothetical protein
MESSTTQNDEVPPVPTTTQTVDVPDVPPTTEEVKEVKLVDVPIDSPNTALNVIVSFLHLAQKRGVFGMDESAKIWDCVKMFQQQQQ